MYLQYFWFLYNFFFQNKKTLLLKHYFPKGNASIKNIKHYFFFKNHPLKNLHNFPYTLHPLINLIKHQKPYYSYFSYLFQYTLCTNVITYANQKCFIIYLSHVTRTLVLVCVGNNYAQSVGFREWRWASVRAAVTSNNRYITAFIPLSKQNYEL